MILDIVLIAVILIGVFIGYKKGFVKVAIKLGTFALSIILAFLLQSSVAEFIGESLGINNTVHTAVENKLTDFSSNNEESQRKKVNIPVLEKTISEINSANEDKKIEIISDWSNKITDFVVNGISFITIFIVVSVLMGIIGLILGTVVKLPVLKTLNGTLGAGIEFVLMMLRISILLSIIYFLSPLNILTAVTDYINTSCIIKWLYENNIIILILGRKIL